MNEDALRSRSNQAVQDEPEILTEEQLPVTQGSSEWWVSSFRNTATFAGELTPFNHVGQFVNQRAEDVGPTVRGGTSETVTITRPCAYQTYERAWETQMQEWNRGVLAGGIVQPTEVQTAVLEGASPTGAAALWADYHRGIKRVDTRPVIFLEPLTPCEAENVVNRIGGSTSEESGYKIALAISTQALEEAQINIAETQEILKQMVVDEVSWCKVEPVYLGGENARPENRPANSSFWRAITKIIEPLRATLAPFTD